MTILKDPPVTLSPAPDEPPRKQSGVRTVQGFTEGRQRTVEISPRSPVKVDRMTGKRFLVFGGRACLSR